MHGASGQHLGKVASFFLECYCFAVDVPDINICDSFSVLNLLTVQYNHVCGCDFSLSEVHNIALLDLGPIETFKILFSAVHFNFAFVDFLVGLATHILKVNSLTYRHQKVNDHFSDVHGETERGALREHDNGGYGGDKGKAGQVHQGS